MRSPPRASSAVSVRPLTVTKLPQRPSCMRSCGVLKLPEDLAGLVEQPVVEHPDDVARVGRGRGVLDDEHAVEAALDLLARADVRVEPERARVLGRELVREGAARFDRRLRDVGDAVHRVGDAHAVPVNRRRLRQLVREPDAQGVAEPDAQLGPGHAAVVRPHAQLAAIDQRQLRLARLDVERADGARRRRAFGVGAAQLARQPRGRGFGAAAAGEQAGEQQEEAGSAHARQSSRPDA